MPMLAVVLTLCLSLWTQPAAPDAPTLKQSIPMPGVKGRIDHLAFDPSTGRVFVAALENGSLEVLDLDKGERTRSVDGLKEPQGVVLVPQSHRVIVACGGDGTARAYDAATLEELAKAQVGDDADNIRLTADGASVVIGYGDGALAVLDAATLKKKADVKLPGHPESFQLEPGTSRAFVNVPGGLVGGGGQVIVADISTGATTASWKLREAGRNFPMALDAPHRRLYVGCRRPAKLLVIDTDSGAVIASPECVGDADDVFVDAKTGRILVTGGDGAIDVFKTTDQGCTKSSSIKTVPGARTGLYIPERRVLLLAVPKRSGRDAEIREYAVPD